MIIMTKLEYEILSEKYRPSNLDEVIGQNDIIKRLKSYVINKNTPNLLFAGSQPGTGKTSTSIALAKELFKENFSSNFLEINASDERGIDIIRNRIKEYANASPIGNSEFKIILLDEADALTNDAQSALRRIMERYTNSCRFILTCNYSSKIIEPIQSRCAVYRFKKLKNEDIINKLKSICNHENIEISNEVLEAISYISEGDLRKAITILDTSKLTSESNKITLSDIYQISSYIEPTQIIDIIKSALSQKFFTSSELLINILMDGISSQDILKQMMSRTFEINIEDKMKVDIISYIGECDWRISEGADEVITLKWLLANIMKLGNLT